MTGDEARNIRRGLRKSAREVGELVGTTESSVYRWELRGNRAVPLMYEMALNYLVIKLAAESEKRSPRNKSSKRAAE